MVRYFASAIDLLVRSKCAERTFFHLLLPLQCHLWMPIFETLPEEHKQLIWKTCTQLKGFLKYDRTSFRASFAMWASDPIVFREHIVTFFGALAYLCQIGAIMVCHSLVYPTQLTALTESVLLSLLSHSRLSQPQWFCTCAFCHSSYASSFTIRGALKLTPNDIS